MNEDRLQSRECMLLELEAEKHCHRKDNEYLVNENNRLKEALREIDRIATLHRRGGIGMAQKIVRAALGILR